MPLQTAKNHPSLSDRTVIVKWVQSQLYKYDPAHPDPGRVTIHRLNRAEYNNTIRDLIGVDFKPAEDFPSDDSGYGFDNIGDVLSLSPVLMEKYLAAATRIMDQAIVTQAIPSQVRHYNANLMEMGFNADGDRGDGWMPLGVLEEDGVSETIAVPTGDYIVCAYVFAKPRPIPAGGGAGGSRHAVEEADRAGARRRGRYCRRPGRFPANALAAGPTPYAESDAAAGSGRCGGQPHGSALRRRLPY